MFKNKIMNYFLKIVATLLLGISVTYAQDQKDSDLDVGSLKPPPRTVTDVLLAVEGAQADPADIANSQALIAAPIPDTKDREVLNAFYRRRAIAFQKLGKIESSIQDLKLATSEYKSADQRTVLESLIELGIFEQRGGSLIDAIKTYETTRASIPRELSGFFMSTNRLLVSAYSQAGNFEGAETALRDGAATLINLKRSPNYSRFGDFWEAELDSARAINFSHQGRWVEAERAYRLALRKNEIVLLRAESEIKKLSGSDLVGAQRVLKNTTQIKTVRQLELATAILRQGRLVEAEIQLREALGLTLKTYAKNSVEVGQALNRFSRIIAEQGRSAEAVILAKEALKASLSGGASSDSLILISNRKTLGSSLVSDRKYSEADKVFEEMKLGIIENAKGGKTIPSADVDWVIAMLKVGKGKDAEAMTNEMLGSALKQGNVSEARLNYLQAFNGMAFHANGKEAEARNVYAKVMPKLVEQMLNDAENQTGSVKQQERMVMLLEDSISLLAKQAKSSPKDAAPAAAQAYSLADLARGSSVQRALSASAARANIKDPQLAELARKEQDTQRRITSLEDLLTGLMSAPIEQQLPGIQAKLKVDINQFKLDREKLKKDIEQKFPDYAQLVNPKPATIANTRQLLKADEVLVSWYFGEKEGFVWAISKTGDPLFFTINLGREEMAKMVMQLRKSLDPGVATIDEIPAFDVALSHALYKSILEPVQSALAGKKVLLTVPHAELGQLPLALLITKPEATPSKKQGGDFIEYRQASWLIKEIAVAQLPSVTALAALRNLPPVPKGRRNFIGFGDPFFSVEQAKIAANLAARSATALATRGIPLNLRSVPKTMGVSSAELALLPRLPDTNEELIEIGKALSADPAQDIFLNKDANVTKVMQMDLSNRQVVMFATHGLIPGELDGLTQPALALSAPAVSGETQGDGLLTMEKILTLKLNADWVVLSACNTASGEGAGAEAVSGLGRAFFYAGARALLVSNWPVDSEASRLLMTDLFKRQQSKPGQNKAEYLQASMVNMINQDASADASGKTKYTYAHPLFWAPFVVVGD